MRTRKASRNLRSASAVTITILILSGSPAICQNDPAIVAHKFVAQGKEIKSLHGSAQRNALKGDRTILGGDVILPTSEPYQGVDWEACIDSDGHVLWSARAQEQPDRVSLFPLETDGDSIWSGGLLKSGIFQLAKFDAKSLRRQASVQLALEPTTNSAPYIQFHTAMGPNLDLQASVVQSTHNAIRAALFSADLRLLLDKLYAFPFVKEEKSLAAAYLIRIPDRTGYYLCLRHALHIQGRTNGVFAILRLDNKGEVKWANGYDIGKTEFEVEPQVTNDGSLLLSLDEGVLRSQHSLIIKIGSDGVINWATSVEGIPVGLNDFQFGWVPYRFTEPYLYANGVQVVSPKVYSILFAINYQTGKIEKQVKFNSPGAIGFVEKTSDSLYVALLNQTASLKPGSSQAALLRLDSDLNLRAARSIRNAEPHLPLLHALPSGKLMFSYSYHDRKTLVVETVNENLESTKSCSVLQKLDFSLAKSNFEARPIMVEAAAFPSIKVSDANSKTTEADIALAPFGLDSAACDPAPH